MTRLHNKYPQPRLKPLARIKDIINRNPAGGNRWLKALALHYLTSSGLRDVPAELKAHLFNHDFLLQETAARGIYQIDPETFYQQIRLLKPADRRRLSQLVDNKNSAMPQFMSTIDKVKFLKGIEFFQLIPEITLVELAFAIVPVLLKASRTVIKTGDTVNMIYLVVSGEIQVQFDSEPMLAVHAGDWVGDLKILTESNYSFSAVALCDTMLFSMKQEQFLSFSGNFMLSGDENLFSPVWHRQAKGVSCKV